MENEFVTYNQALALKELGFDEPCMASRDMNNDEGLIQIPLKQQAFRWMREKYNLCGTITPQSYEIWGYPDGGCIIEQYPVHTYEEAEHECLNKLIEIVKQK